MSKKPKVITKHFNFKHGMSYTSEYSIWTGIRSRAFGTKSKYLDRYKHKGITMCDRWLDSFINFYTDMGPRPTLKHSIDRIDNKGPYSPENCRWATPSEQCNNRSNNRTILFKGETLTLANLGCKYNKCPKLIRTRLSRGWDLQKAVFDEKQ